LYFVVCKFNLYSDYASACRKPLVAEPPKKTIKPRTASQTVSLIITTPIPPPAGVTGSMMLSPAEAWDHYRRVTEFLEGLKDREVDREDNSFPPLLHFPSDVLAKELAIAQKALSNEKFARSTADQALAEERASRQAAKEALLRNQVVSFLV
jgi:hypothetical protein